MTYASRDGFWRVNWETGAEKTPEGFLYVMYPGGEAVPVFASPTEDAERIGVLDRAMVNSHPELTQKYIRLLLPNETEGWVRRDSLVFSLTDTRRTDQLFTNLQRFDVSTGLEPNIDALRRRLIDGGSERFVLILRYEGGSMLRWTYVVANGEARPVRYDDLHEGTAAFGFIFAIVGAGAAWVVCFVILKGAGFLLFRATPRVS